jgi:hypothetical protein
MTEKNSLNKRHKFDEDKFIAVTSKIGFTITGKMIYDGGDRAYSKLRIKKALIEKNKHILKNPDKVPMYRIESTEDWEEFDEKISALRKASSPPALIHFGEEKALQ